MLLRRNNLNIYQSTTDSLVLNEKRKEWLQHNKLKQVTKQRFTETIPTQLVRYTLAVK